MLDRPCSCGSNAPRYLLKDAAGIPLAYVCSECEARKRATYNPAVFDTCSRYAVTGEEIDLDAAGDDDSMF